MTDAEPDAKDLLLKSGCQPAGLDRNGYRLGNRAGAAAPARFLARAKSPSIIDSATRHPQARCLYLAMVVDVDPALFRGRHSPYNDRCRIVGDARLGGNRTGQHIFPEHTTKPTPKQTSNEKAHSTKQPQSIR